MAEEKFLIDSNALMTPHLSYYPFDLAPSFWEQIEAGIKSKRIIILDMVKAEVLQGNDSLRDWMDNLVIDNLEDRRQPDILVKYAEALSHVQNNPCYAQAALHEWSKATVADPWIIAAAAAKGYTIITFEKTNANLSPKNPTKKVKIPDVARALGVKTQNLFYMMRELAFRL